MTKVQLLEREIKKLGRSDLAKLRRWFQEFDADAWDRQFERDIASGSLASLAKEAAADFKSGKTREI